MTGAASNPSYVMLVQYADAFLHDASKLLLPHTSQVVRTYLDERLTQAEKDIGIYFVIHGLEERLTGFRGGWFRFRHSRDTRTIRDKLENAIALIERDADYTRVCLPLEREQEYWGAINHIQWAEGLMQPLIPLLPPDLTLEPAIQAWLMDLRRQTRRA